MAQAVAKGRFAEVITNDIDPTAPTPNHHDLRKRWMWESVAPDWCVTNPPFCLLGETFNLALDYSRKGVALLVRLSVLEVCKGRERIELYPPDRMIVLPQIKFRGQGTDNVSVCVDDSGRSPAPSYTGVKSAKPRSGCSVSKRTARLITEGVAA